MKNLVFFLEGQAEEAVLKGLVPRFLNPQVEIKYVTFQGKKDLESKINNRLKGWRKPNSAFVVLVDQDQEDCQQLKSRIISKCPDKVSSSLLIRIACNELESWYFGDLSAVGKALNNNLTQYKNKSRYREPDKIQKPSKELDKITKGAYQKVSGSKAIGKHLSLEGNTSPSFQTFIKGIQKLCLI